MGWNVVIWCAECPFREFNCYSDDICLYGSSLYKSNKDKPCNIENCPIKEVN